MFRASIFKSLGSVWLIRLIALSLAMTNAIAQTPARPAIAQEFDVIVKGGTVYDGTGAPGRVRDVGLRGDRIAALGDLSRGKAKELIDAAGLAVAPGFINMLSWSTVSLIQDGRAQSEIRQGVTTQIMGEGVSMGPLNPEMKQRMLEQQGDIKYAVEWTTLAEYLRHLERRGVSPNVASFIGATTIREHVIGLEDKQPTPEQLQQMRDLVEREMKAGALGIATSLIYPPAFYAKTEELIELCKVAAKYNGRYISHLRSEGNQLLEALDELIRISRGAGIPAEVYHIKALGTANWSKIDKMLANIEAAQKEGLKITANMYVYEAAGTGLDACLPPWTADGGYPALFKRLRDPATRQKIAAEIRSPNNAWENFYLGAGSPERIILSGFKSEKLKHLTGKSLAEVAKMRGQDPIEAMMDLIPEDDSRIETIYFLMSEENIRKEIKKPWITFGSDEAAQAPEGVFLKSNPHPRAYGNFARVLGKYVREEKLLSLSEAVRRMSALPAENVGFLERGVLKEGMFADLIVFDPTTITDRATVEKPHQYALGMTHVFVNGIAVLKNGEHTGAKPGRALGRAAKE